MRAKFRFKFQTAAVIVIPGWCVSTRPKMCSCTSGNLEIPGAMRPSCLHKPCPSKQRAQGKPGVRCTRSRACSVESTRVSHHRFTGNIRLSPRNGFNGLLRALPGDRACLSPSLTNNSVNLNASVGASGPHDFAVRNSIIRPRAFARLTLPRPPHPAPTSVTTAKRPSCGTGWRGF